MIRLGQTDFRFCYQVSSINSSSHAESAFASRVQDHLEMSMIGLADTEKGSKEIVLGLLGQHFFSLAVIVLGIGRSNL